MLIDEVMKLDPCSEEFMQEILMRERQAHECIGQLYRSILYGETATLRHIRYRAKVSRVLPMPSLPPALPCNSYDTSNSEGAREVG